MSRLKSLKEKIRKKTIKTTMASLALALAIGSTQIMGTYALFTDIEDVPSYLSISTGDIDVEVSEGLDFTDVQPGQKIEIPVTITNQGTLNQNISINLTISDNIKQHLTTSIMFNEEIIIRDGIMYKNGELLILSPGQTIDGSINITVGNMNADEQNKLYGKVQSVNLSVESTQIRDDNTLVNNGFYDTATQSSSIMIGKHEENVIYGEAVKVTPASGYDEDSTVELRVSSTNHYSGLDSLIDNISDVIKKDYEIISRNGAFKNTNVFTIGQQWWTFENPVNTKLITASFGDGNDISIKLKYRNGTFKTYKFDFKEIGKDPKGNRLLAAKVTLEEEGKNIIENEIILDQSEVEQSKEEIIESSGINRDEPPKEEVEPELVDTPKVEEVVVPSQPDIIEPSKEEIETQE